MHRHASLGGWIKQRRTELDLTQAELAQRVGCATITIRKIEAEQLKPSRQIAHRLAEQLELAPVERDHFVQIARTGPTETDRSPVASAPAPQPPTVTLRTPLIGRAHELADVCCALTEDEVRLLTLVGPPGIGKTRLSLEVAHELSTHFADGVQVVGLAPLSDPALVIPTIAQTLGIAERPDQPITETLAVALRPKHLLLVLDNVEQVVAAAPDISALLQAAPRVHMLATSRIPLHVYGEHQYAMPPLALPPLERIDRLTLHEIHEYEAVRLFVARARAVRPTFALSEDTTPIVVEICRRLDGLPLAIELAAARIKHYTPRELLLKLAQPLPLLAHGPCDLPPRHQTLRNAIAWSYNLLAAPEQQFFDRLGVFRGGWTTEAAAALASSADPVEDLLAALHDKSMIRRTESADGATRWNMLETLREFALERLVATGALHEIRAHHAAYFVQLAETAAPHIVGPNAVAWLDRLEREHDNFRAALGWSQTPEGDPELGLRMAVALSRFWLSHSYLSEGRRWLEQTLAQEMNVSPALRARALFEAGGLADQQGDHDRQRVLQHEALGIFRELGDTYWTARVLNCLGNAAGTPAECAAIHEESLALFREIDNTDGIALVLVNLGCDIVGTGDVQRGLALLEEGLSLHRSLNNTSGMAYALSNLGGTWLDRGNFAAAVPYAQESLGLFHQLGDRLHMAYALESVGDAAGALGQPICAARLYGAADGLFDRINLVFSPAELEYLEGFRSVARAQLDAATFDAAYNEGRALSLDQAVAEALQFRAETT